MSQKYAQIKHINNRKWSKTVLAMNIHVRGQDGLKRSIIRDYGLFIIIIIIYFDVINGLKLECINNGFLTNKQLFTSQDINWWSWVVWIIVVFLSAVRLILTAPIWKASIGNEVM